MCKVFALRTPGEADRVSARVCVTKPTAFSSISYTPNQVYISVGENSPKLKLN